MSDFNDIRLRDSSGRDGRQRTLNPLELNLQMTENRMSQRTYSGRENKSLEWAISPYGAAVFSSVIFLLAWLLPPWMYAAGLDEPDYIWLDPLSFLLFASCAVAFVLGVRLCDTKAGFQPGSPLPANAHAAPYIALPLVLAIAFELFAFILIVKQEPGIIAAVLSGAGRNVKSDIGEMVLPAGISAAWAGSLAVMYWAVHAYLTLNNQRGKKIVSRVLAVYVGISLALPIVAVSRNQLMMIVVGLMVIGAAHRVRKRRKNAGTGKLLILAIVAFAAIFLGIGLIRGTSRDEMLGAFYGYTISGYNRMAAIIHHQVPYLDAGNGDHMFNGILQNRTVNSLIPFQSMYNLPDPLDVWLDDFAAVGSAGLWPSYTFASCFGFIFIDAGWWTPAVVFLTGMFSGFIWRRFKQGTTLGVVVYPVVFFSALMWFGTNMLIHMNTIMAILIAAALVLYGIPYWYLALITPRAGTTYASLES